MCGITGFWAFRPHPQEELASVAHAMALRIISRGPDSADTWADPEAGMALGHRRLKIVDLSEAGHQPMMSHSGRYVLSYNGELYNAQELRKQLETYTTFKGTSDTEVLVEAIALWGVEEACQRFLGMFAFSVWDRKKRTLYLVRDRLGVKPLYWGLHKGILLFGSQPKSFYGHPSFDPSIDKAATNAFFHYGYVPTPHCIFEGIQKVPPGTIVTIENPGTIKETIYWSAQKLDTTPYTQPEDVLIEKAEKLLIDAVQRRMVADVPLGAFLSGGIDSSLVVSLMQRLSPTPIHTFSIGFHEKKYDEAPYAEAVAAHLGTQHHTLYVKDADACSVIDNLSTFYDEPFADSSQIPTYILSRFARQDVTVALSGDGGDELFAGYTRYVVCARLIQYFRFIPERVRQSFGRVLQALPETFWRTAGLFLPKHLSKIEQLGRYCFLKPEELYDVFVRVWPVSPLLVNAPTFENPIQVGNQRTIEKMQLMDLLMYLPDDILTKVDRASMAVGLEARGPLLDHRLVEFAFRLPLSMRIRGGKGKWLLRTLLQRYVPHHLINRPKMGFGIPLQEWLQGPLRTWAQDTIADACQNDWLDGPQIQKTWDMFLSGREQSAHKLWTVLMFQQWTHTYKNVSKSADAETQNQSPPDTAAAG